MVCAPFAGRWLSHVRSFLGRRGRQSRVENCCRCGNNEANRVIRDPHGQYPQINGKPSELRARQAKFCEGINRQDLRAIYQPTSSGCGLERRDLFAALALSLGGRGAWFPSFGLRYSARGGSRPNGQRSMRLDFCYFPLVLHPLEFVVCLSYERSLRARFFRLARWKGRKGVCRLREAFFCFGGG